MPRLNTLGDVLAGIARPDGPSVNGVVPAALSTAEASYWGWYTNTIIAGPANFGGGYQTYTYDLGTTTLTGHGGGELAFFNAGNSVYAGWKPTGAVTSVSGLGPFPQGGFADVSDTGAIGIIVNNTADSGLRMYSNTGTLLSQWATVLSFPSAVRMRGDVCAYAEAGGWFLRTISTGASIAYQQQTSPVNAMVPVTQASGRLLVLERTTAGGQDTVTLRQAATGQAYRIVTGGNQLNPDARELSPNVVRIALSVNTGESPAGLRLYDLNLATGALSQGVVSGGSIVWTPIGTAPTVTLSIRPVGGSTSGLAIEALQRQRVVEPMTGLMDRNWYRWAVALTKQAVTPVNLANVSGVLSPANGGNGTTTGVTDIIAAQLQVSATDRVLGRDSAGAGDGEELTADAVLAWFGLYRVTVPLTNAQIKALPTTPITLAAAPGAGKRIVVLRASLRIDSAAGAYTNLNATYAAVALYWLGDFSQWATVGVVDDVAATLTRLTSLIGGAAVSVADLPSYLDATASGWVVPNVFAASIGEDKALALAADNNGSGAFTGGNAANTGRVDVLYRVIG